MKLQVTKHFTVELSEPNELIELMSEDDKINFMQSLSCHDSVITHVADQIIHGQTRDGYSGSETITKALPCTALQSARREIAINSSDISSSEIKSLQRQLAEVEKLKDEFMSKYYDLYYGRV